jgi:hypothetical protein
MPLLRKPESLLTFGRVRLSLSSFCQNWKMVRLLFSLLAALLSEIDTFYAKIVVSLSFLSFFGPPD